MTLNMVLETSDFFTKFSCKRLQTWKYYHWVLGTYSRITKYGFSMCHPGDFRKFLRENFGRNAVGSKYPTSWLSLTSFSPSQR